jgi:hypothetical protein
VASLGNDLGFADEPSVHRKGRAMCPTLIVALQINLAGGVGGYRCGHAANVPRRLRR